MLNQLHNSVIIVHAAECNYSLCFTFPHPTSPAIKLPPLSDARIPFISATVSVHREHFPGQVFLSMPKKVPLAPGIHL